MNSKILFFFIFHIFIFLSKPSFAVKVLILSLNALPHYEDFLEEVEPHHRVLMLPAKKLTQEEEEPRRLKYRDIFKVENYLESAEVEQKSKELYDIHPFDYIIATDEFDILRAARLREFLGLPGQQYDSAIAFRDKIVMKSLLEKKGIIVPRFKKIKSGVDLLEFAKINSFPFVVKPRRGAGSLGTTLIRSEIDLQNLLLRKGIFNDYHQAKLEAEQFIEGDMYHINGIVVGGKVVACWPSLYITNPISILERDNLSSYLIPSQDPLVRVLNGYAESVLQALPTPLNTVFHLETFVTQTNEIIFCEIASRVGGCGVNPSWKESFGVDLMREFVRLQGGLSVSEAALNFSYEPSCISGEVLFPKKKGTVIKVPSECPFSWVKEFKVYSKVGDVLVSPDEVGDRIADIPLLVASSKEEFEERMNIANSWFYENTTIED
ncbi:MAG: ATP-grasp domain-containing protein [Alphaproteobacteria bacterium]|nr:ATP-grasp domain-containing protein [Alphaproteobacteria bacterium]